MVLAGKKEDVVYASELNTIISYLAALIQP
jgi:hypothetical protein